VDARKEMWGLGLPAYSQFGCLCQTGLTWHVDDAGWPPAVVTDGLHLLKKKRSGNGR